MTRLLFVIAMSALLIGCAANPQKRFSETVEQVRSTANIDVVVDSFIVSDIRGKSLGYNVDTNNQRATELKNTIVSVLESKGYKPNVVFVGSGYQQPVIDEREIFYSSDWTSTGEILSQGQVLEGDVEWKEIAAVDYFGAVLEEALGANWTPPKYDLSLPFEKRARDVRLGLTQDQKDARQVIFAKKPEALLGGTSDNILFVKYANLHVSVGKKLALGIVSGATSLAASGGTSATVMTVSELGPMELAVVDKSTQEILWAHSVPNTSPYKGEETKVNHMLHFFPSR